MIKEDYSKYLSYDNGHGLLLSSSDVVVLDRYHIHYQNCSSLKDLLLLVEEVVDDDESDEDLILVLEHLEEMYYYHEVHK